MTHRTEASGRTLAAAAAVALCLVLAGMVGGAFGFFRGAYGIRQSTTLPPAGRPAAATEVTARQSDAVVAAEIALGLRPAPAVRRAAAPRRSLSSTRALAMVMSSAFPYRSSVFRAAARHAVDPALIFAIIASESKGDPAALSPSGAIGLMQLMPSTALELGVDPWDPEENIEGAVRYLAGLLEQMGMDRERAEQIRQMLQANQQALAEQLDQHSGEKIAENMSEQPPDRNGNSLLQRPFDSLSDKDLFTLRKDAVA